MQFIVLFFFERHLKTRHDETYKEYLRQVDSGASTSQPSMLAFMNPSQQAVYSHNNNHQRTLTTSLVKNLIIDCGLPISIVDHTSFRSFVSDLDPKFVPPCRQTITYSILPQLLSIKKERVKSLVEKCFDIALTTDIWTDRRSHAFLAVTAHAFVSGKPINMLLSFKALPGSHNGERISEALCDIVEEYNLQTKVRCIVTDNASNMRKAMDVMFSKQDDIDDQTAIDDASLWCDLEVDLNLESVFHGKREHISCFAHSLQLVVRDGLKVVSSGRPFLSKCCKISNILHQSALFRSRFEAVMGSGRTIPSSNDTRWNSVFRQLNSFLLLDIVLLNEILTDTNHQNLILAAKDMSQLKELVNILNPFAEATDLTQGENVVTLSCVVPIILSLRAKLEDYLSDPGSFCALATTLLHSLYNRFASIFQSLDISSPPDFQEQFHSLRFDSPLFILAPALDPQYAYYWLQDYPGSEEQKEAIRYKINGLCSFNKIFLLYVLLTTI